MIGLIIIVVVICVWVFVIGFYIMVFGWVGEDGYVDVYVV